MMCEVNCPQKECDGQIWGRSKLEAFKINGDIEEQGPYDKSDEVERKKEILVECCWCMQEPACFVCLTDYAILLTPNSLLCLETFT